MPNRVNNYFSASSDDTELMAELHDKIINENNHLDFNLAVPMPEDQKENRYDWSCKNRWCKRNANWEVWDTINNDHTQINFTFDTPRSPPIYWFAALCKMFPEISMSLDYEEPGCWFEGTIQSDWEGWYRDDEREYQETCNHCDEKHPTAKRYDEAWENVCDACLAEIVPEEMWLYKS